MGKYSTYGTMAKWLKWSSFFILLIPLALFIMACVQLGGVKFDQYDQVAGALDIVLLVLSVIWVILNIMLFFTAGTIRTKASPTGIRVGLLFSFILVISPIIVGILIYYGVIDKNSQAMNVVELLLPLIVVIGYLVGFSCARSIQSRTN